jgi:hypothetical protein
MHLLFLCVGPAVYLHLMCLHPPTITTTALTPTPTAFICNVSMHPGELHDYVVGELNVRELEVCADPLKYATLRAEPDFQVSTCVWGRCTLADCHSSQAMQRQFPGSSEARQVLPAVVLVPLDAHP